MVSKKFTEVVLPPEAINQASARQWWARPRLTGTPR